MKKDARKVAVVRIKARCGGMDEYYLKPGEEIFFAWNIMPNKCKDCIEGMKNCLECRGTQTGKGYDRHGSYPVQCSCVSKKFHS